MAVACGRGSDDGAAGSTSDLATGVTLAPATTIPVTKSGPAFSTQTQAVIVAGANQYLAAWTELHLATKKSSVVAARIGADGKLLDERSITFPASAGDDGSIALAFDGTGYLAVWSHKSGSTSVIKGLRVGADGKLVDAQPFTLGRANGMATAPAVAYTTGGYLVTWSDDRDSGASADSYVNEVYGARISTAGAVVGPAEGFRITNAPGTLDGSLSVAAVGSTFLVGYAKRTGNVTVPQAVRVSDAGTVLDATPLSFGAGGDLGAAPAIAADGSQFFVAWNDVATQKLSGTRVTKDGAKVDDSAIEISTNHPVAPAVTWDGDAFSVAWKYGTQRVGANGVLVGTAMSGGAGAIAEERPAVASVGSSLFVVHYVDADTDRGLPLRLSANLLPKAGGAAIQSDVFLARGPSLQRSVASAAHGATSLSVWLEYEDPSHPKVNGALFANGTATPIAIDPGANNLAPTVAWDGTTYAVAWQSDATSKVVHVNDAGSVIDTAVAYPGGRPSLTTGSPNKVLLTTHDASNAPQGWFVGNPSAKVLESAAAEPAGWISGPTAKPAWDGSRYVLAWPATKSDGNVEIHAQRFDKTGRAMDVPAVKIATLPLPQGAALPTVTLATNGVDTLIAFDAPTSHQVLGARLTPSGVADTTPVRLDAGTSGFAFEPRLAWDGTQWTLAYERRSDAIATDPAGYPLELTRIRATSSGLAVNGPAEAIANRALLPAVTAGASGVTFLGYESIGTDDLAGPRISLTLFTDSTGAAPPGSSSGGTTTGGDDDDDSAGPAAPGDGDGDPKKPSGPKIAPTKGATIKPGAQSGSAANGGGDGGGGCSSTGGGSSSSSLLFLAIGALCMHRRRRS